MIINNKKKGNSDCPAYDFDEIIDRKGTGALKIEALKERYGDPDLMPLWVADMEFETPKFITDALKQRLKHSLFGYTVMPPELWPTVIGWVRDHSGWEIKEEWLSFIPGIVKGIGMAINVFVKQDEKVIIQPPVYHPFRLVPMGNGREVVYNPLLIRENGGSYVMDFDGIEKIADSKTRLLILSNPHNPGGIVWDRDSLKLLADFCYDHNIIVVSDEIHCDMTLFGNKHIPFASVSDKAEQISITFQAPSKTFNIAGLVSSFAIVPNPKLRQKLFGWLQANELNEPDIFAPIATIAAYKYWETWRKAMISYVENNINYVMDFCKQNIPQIIPWKPQASFLVWLDCRQLNLNHDQLIDLFQNKAKLALNDGLMFGSEGEGFMRMNVAAPKTIITEALNRLKNAITSL